MAWTSIPMCSPARWPTWRGPGSAASTGSDPGLSPTRRAPRRGARARPATRPNGRASPPQ
jgi:hypothetical protein